MHTALLKAACRHAGDSSIIGRVLLIVAVVALPGCGLFGGNEEEDPPAELVRFEPELRIKKAWSAGIGDGTEALRLALVPASDGAKVYAAAHDGKVAAFDGLSGERQWRTKTDLPLSAGPATDGELVVAGSSDGDVVALDAASGEELWRTKVTSEVLAAPAIREDRVFVRSVDGKLIALDAADGSEIWFVQQTMPRLSVRGTAAPVVQGDRVICGFDNGRLAAYDTLDGALVWDALLAPPSGRTEVERLSDINARALVVAEDIYAVSYQGSLSAVAAESGQVLWTRDIPSHRPMSADFLNLYLAADSSEIVAVARGSGREVWRVDTLLNRNVTGTAVTGRSVAVGDFEGYVHWFSTADGSLQARVRAGSAPVATPLAANGLLYVLSDRGKLYAYRDATEREPASDDPDG